MAILGGTWREVTNHRNAPKARSSHAVALVGSKAYVFGGEFQPRVPIDSNVYVLDVESRRWSIAESKGEPPKPRVGVTLAAIHHMIYVFGGRDEDHEELNDFYSFDTQSGEWKLLSSGDNGPPHRSYHAMAADIEGNCLFIFGGCGKAGRLNDLWVFDFSIGHWEALNLPPLESKCVPRGGSGLAVVDGAVWVIFGFSGQELSDIHRYDLKSHMWEEVNTSGEKPTGRSVFGTAAIGNNIVLYGGEVDPSDQGHLGAGSFSSDVFVLDIKKLTWRKLSTDLKEGNHPGARGWYAFASSSNSMLIYGGNSETNDRLDDMHLLTLEVSAE